MFKSNIPRNLERMCKAAMKRWRAEGLAEGRAEGKVEGKAEGKAEGRVEGKEEGRVEGRIEGRAEGRAEALLCLLRERFGVVKPSLHKRIRKANLVTLDRWFKRAIVAPDLLSVFGRPR